MSELSLRNPMLRWEMVVSENFATPTSIRLSTKMKISFLPILGSKVSVRTPCEIVEKRSRVTRLRTGM